MKLAIVHPSGVAGNFVSATLSRTFGKMGIPCESSLYDHGLKFKKRYKRDGPFDKVFLKDCFSNIEETGSPDLVKYMKERGYEGELFLISDKAMDPSFYRLYEYPVKRTFCGPLNDIVIQMKGYFSDNG